MIKLSTSDLNVSEFIGNSWQNTHESKSVKSENVQNDKKSEKVKIHWQFVAELTRGRSEENFIIKTKDHLRSNFPPPPYYI